MAMAMMMAKIATITKAVFMFRTWRQNLPTNDFTCSPDFIWAHTVRWHKYKSPALQMIIQSYTNSVKSMGHFLPLHIWILTVRKAVFMWYYWTKRLYSRRVFYTSIYEKEQLKSKLVCKNRGTLLIYIWCMQWTAPSYSNFFSPNFLPQIPEEMWPGPYCPGAFFGHSSSEWSFSIQVLPHHHQSSTSSSHLCKNWDDDDEKSCRPPSSSFSNLFFRLTFDFLPRWPPRCLNTYSASRRYKIIIIYINDYFPLTLIIFRRSII